MSARPGSLLADDHTMLLHAFRWLLEPACDVVGKACASPDTHRAAGGPSRHLVATNNACAGG